MNLTRQERETIVRTSDADDVWYIYTASPKMIRKFEKQGYDVDRKGVVDGKYYKVPFRLVSFRKNAPKRRVTRAQRNALRKRFLAANSEQIGNSKGEL